MRRSSIPRRSRPRSSGCSPGAGFHDALIIAIAVLIITCPCALALAVPAVQVVAAGALFRAGSCLDAGDAIERLARRRHGRFRQDRDPDPAGAGARQRPMTPARPAVECAARLALSSHHPLAQALAARADDRTPLDAAEEIAGAGVRAMIDGQEARLGAPSFCDLEAEAEQVRKAHPEASVIAFRRGAETAVFRIRQKPRPDARSVIASLQALGFPVAILSGDAAPAVSACAQALGVEQWSAAMRPQEKIAWLAARKAEGRKVMMVGDGMNDAPALAAAYASLSPITAVGSGASRGRCGVPRRAARPGRRGDRHCSPRQFADAPEPPVRGGLQSVAVPLAMAGLVTPLIAAPPCRAPRSS